MQAPPLWAVPALLFPTPSSAAQPDQWLAGNGSVAQLSHETDAHWSEIVQSPNHTTFSVPVGQTNVASRGTGGSLVPFFTFSYLHATGGGNMRVAFPGAYVICPNGRVVECALTANVHTSSHQEHETFIADLCEQLRSECSGKS